MGPVCTPRVFFYRNRVDATALRDSLTRTLADYPVVTGRLTKDPDGGFSVLCDDAGVRLTEVEHPGTLPAYGFDRRAEKDIGRFLDQVNPFKVVDGKAPLLTVKLTRFADGGSVLGITINHVIADDFSLLRFMEDWSRRLRGLAADDGPTPCHDRTLLDALGATAPGRARAANREFAVTSRLAKLAMVGKLVLRAGQLATVTVRFSPGEVTALKGAAMADLAGTDRWVSTNDALSAHLWQMLGDLRTEPRRTWDTLGVVVDLRSRLAGALPEQYWGNAAGQLYLSMATHELRSGSLGTVAEAVRGGLGGLTEHQVREDVAFLDAQRTAHRLQRVANPLTREVYRPDSLISLNNRANLPFYAMDFGAGRPFWCEYPPVGFPWTVDIMPVPDGDGGRDVHLSVPRTHAAALRTEPWQKRLHRFG
jgi:shikimate O-hydroxycinnamoyltransferase